MVTRLSLQLDYLCLDLTPHKFFYCGFDETEAREKQAYTIILRATVARQCTGLRAPARIVSHSLSPPWSRAPPGITGVAGEASWWPNLEDRSRWLHGHACLQQDPSQLTCRYGAPEGFSCKWCGFAVECCQQHAHCGYPDVEWLLFPNKLYLDLKEKTSGT